MGNVINNWCLKISLTSKCNLNCFYCNDFQKSVVEGKKELSNEEIKDIIKAAAEAGITKIHWTGGEPSVANLLEFSDYAKECGYEEQNITTNGYLMGDKIERMVENGLVRTNISLDSLDREKFKKIVGIDGLEQVLKTIRLSADKVMLTKINVCLMKENFDEIEDLINFASTLGEGVIIKFFELWKFQPNEKYLEMHIEPEVIKNRILQIGEIAPLDNIKGNNPNVDYFLVKDKNVKVGIVEAPKQYKCGGPSCKKIRVYTTGKTCEGRQIVEGDYDEKVRCFKELMERRSNTIVNR